MMELRNKVNRKELRALSEKENRARRTVSFYRYISIKNPQQLRDTLFAQWTELECWGRIYVSTEGINAQMNVPREHWDAFVNNIQQNEYLKDVPLKIGVEENAPSFFKLTIKVKQKIVADGLSDAEIDLQKIGKHIHADEMNRAIEDENAVIIDMRNHYEYEIGHFEGAICPNTETFRDALPKAVEMAEDHKDKEVVLYCTGGIRCEKASAYFLKKGFKNVKQMCGGIIDYKHEVDQKGVPNRYRGKNFVFDERKAEVISPEVVSQCHQCDAKCDHHVNCENDACHLLFLQCDTCREKHGIHCSPACKAFTELPADQQRIRRRTGIAVKKALNVYSRHQMKNLKNQVWN